MNPLPDALRVALVHDGADRCVALHGELTHATAADLDRLLHDTGAAWPDLVLDVSGLAICDSAGLAALLGVERRARHGGGGVTLRGVHGSLRRLLRLTGADELLRPVPAAVGEDGEDGEVPEGRRA